MPGSRLKNLQRRFVLVRGWGVDMDVEEGDDQGCIMRVDLTA